MLGLAGFVGVPKKLREGTRSHEGIEGIPTDHPLLLVDSRADVAPRISATEETTDGGYV